jgi:hypothetical protein
MINSGNDEQQWREFPFVETNGPYVLIGAALMS